MGAATETFRRALSKEEVDAILDREFLRLEDMCQIESGEFDQRPAEPLSCRAAASLNRRNWSAANERQAETL